MNAIYIRSGKLLYSFQNDTIFQLDKSDRRISLW